MANLLQKIKSKLVEELESETDQEQVDQEGPEEHFSGPTSDREKALIREVKELKDHINKNYQVYIRRLEKRKERIKELEEYSRLLLSDNETLQKQLQGFDHCQKQLSEAKDNLEQLEGFQNQELAKVKHMLLSAEKNAEDQKRQRDGLEEGNVQLQKTVKVLEAKIKSTESPAGHEHYQESIKQYQETISELEGKLKVLAAAEKQSDLSNKELVESPSGGQVSELSAQLAEATKRISELTVDRDALKNSLLELEITVHEKEESSASANELKTLKLELARLATEKETLEVTLELRDKDLKSRKEDLQSKQVDHERALEELRADVSSKSSRISSLEAELSHLKEKLNEESKQVEKLSGQVESSSLLLKSCQEELSKKEKSFSECSTQANELREKVKKLTGDKERLEQQLSASISKCDDVIRQFNELSKENELLKPLLTDVQVERNDLRKEVELLKVDIADKEATFDKRVEKTDLVKTLKSELQEAKDEIVDKHNTIRLHQQRMTDMKKTFQKELRSSATVPNFADLSNGPTTEAGSSSTASPGPTTTSSRASPPTLDVEVPSSPIVTMTDVNFKYLKHVIFKFFTSPEYEAKHLTRAISALLKLSRDEERLLHEHLEWKMSWFGTRPKLGTGQFSLSIDPSS